MKASSSKVSAERREGQRARRRDPGGAHGDDSRFALGAITTSAAGGRAGRRRPASACPPAAVRPRVAGHRGCSRPAVPPTPLDGTGLDADVDGAGAAYPEPLAVRRLQVGADVRGEGTNRRRQLRGGPGGIEPALGRVDLLGVGRLALVLLLELEPSLGAEVERPDQQLAAEARQASRRAPRSLSSASIGTSARSATGPESSPAVSFITQTPVCRSPAMIARSIGAAPRQRGSSEGCTFSIGCAESSGSRISWPKAQTTTTRGLDGARSAPARRLR